VEKFDQLGTGPGQDDLGKPAGLPDKDGKPGSGISMIMMDQWLEQIEGDPSYLLRNQFMIEERQELDRRGRMVMETRPW
jgi:Ca-activated chloride channel family protein